MGLADDLPTPIFNVARHKSAACGRLNAECCSHCSPMDHRTESELDPRAALTPPWLRSSDKSATAAWAVSLPAASPEFNAAMGCKRTQSRQL